ncbi:hypothetical protein T12_461, partial [Trichinella patagoniensis]
MDSAFRLIQLYHLYDRFSNRNQNFMEWMDFAVVGAEKRCFAIFAFFYQ